MASAILFVYFARRSSGFAFVPWPENKRNFILSAFIMVLPTALAAFLTSSLIVRIGVAGAAVAIYGVLILTRVLNPEERAALQRMVPFALRGREKPA
jgi:hypothetical protein